MNVPLKPEKRKPNSCDVASAIGERYIVKRSIGQGSFGEIFECYDKLTRMVVAIKIEKKSVAYPQLEYESKVYRLLHQPQINLSDILPPQMQLSELACEFNLGFGWSTKPPPQQHAFVAVGIPTLYSYKSKNEYNIMVLELCGPSLEDLFNYCHRRFSLKTVLMLAEQMLHRIEYIHGRGLIHRDIKTENFVFGTGNKSHILYLIDFGLSKMYWNNRRQMHIAFVDGKSLTGTARYCSINAHRGYEQSRRDDLESIGYVLIYLLKGSLPWQGLQDQDHHLRLVKIGERKITLTSEELCKGIPKEFLEYCRYCRNLSFQQRPSYNYLRNLFWKLAKRMGYVYGGKDAGIGAENNMRSTSRDINCDLTPKIVSVIPLEDTTTRSSVQLTIKPNIVTTGTSRVVCPMQNRTHGRGDGEIINYESLPLALPVCTTNAISNCKIVDVSTFDRSPCGDVLNLSEREGEAERVNDANFNEEVYYDWIFDWFDKRERELQRGRVISSPTSDRDSE